MKKIKIVKAFALSLCLVTVFSTTTFAKDTNKFNQYKQSKIAKCSIDTLPVDVQFPD